jgi:lipid-binding SYLF domain-containing protein
MIRLICLALAACVLFTIPLASTAEAGPFRRGDKKASKAAEKRRKIDAMAEDTMASLFSKSSSAKAVSENAHAWAVFNNVKVSLGLTGGGGSGVAVAGDARTYMKMGTGGVNIGLGAQKYQVIFFFEDAKTLSRFTEKGWEADASANAVAGTKGANAEATFNDGLAIFQLTEAGLMLQADLSGTKYWKSDKLNAR